MKEQTNWLSGRSWLYLPLLLLSVFYLIPMYIMLVTGFKSFAEVDLQTMWNLPSGLHIENFIAAWQQLQPNIINTFMMVVPAAIISSFLGSINGFVLARWQFPGANIIFPLLLFGMFIPYQSILIPWWNLCAVFTCMAACRRWWWPTLFMEFRLQH